MNNDLISLDLPDHLLSFLAVYSHRNDMKIDEAINAILIEYIENMEINECQESHHEESSRDDERLEAKSVVQDD